MGGTDLRSFSAQDFYQALHLFAQVSQVIAQATLLFTRGPLFFHFTQQYLEAILNMTPHFDQYHSSNSCFQISVEHFQISAFRFHP